MNPADKQDLQRRLARASQMIVVVSSAVNELSNLIQEISMEITEIDSQSPANST